MLTITLDEAYVFDLLSIYTIKLDNSTTDKYDVIYLSLTRLSTEIVSQIGVDLYKKILSSEEYKELVSSNRKVFELVAMANDSELSKITSDANYDRFIKKTKLQNKFFPTKLTEVKL